MNSNTETSLFDNKGELVTKAQRAGKRETVRSQIALYYVLGFFIVIMVSLLVGWWGGYKVDEFKDFLLAISGVLSGPLGFIIGFYFKESSGSDEEIPS